MSLKIKTFCFFFSFLLLRTHQRPLDAKQHLHIYGFLDTSDPSPKALEEGIKKFQMVNNLTVTGLLNDDTMERMKSPRCGRPSNAPLFLSARDKWRKTHLTYKISNWTNPFTKSDIKKIFEDAIMAWTDNVGLRITETTSNRADIEIYFTEQDGPRNVLGYAFFPEHGDIFFDKDEDWTVDQSLAASKTGFVWVATHELGHSLGMPHTETMDSVMFPYYSQSVTKPSGSDVMRLRRLYGEATLNNSILCDGASVDAILDIENPLLIKGKEYWIISNGSLQNGPFSLDLMLPELPEKIDAAFMIGETSYFLSSNIFYKFNHKKKTLSQKKLISAGFDNIPGDIDATFFDPASSQIYFFKGSRYYALDIKKPVGKRLVVNGKSMPNDWDGLPKNIEAATLLENSRVLFIKRSKCYVANLNSKRIISEESCSSTFFKC